MGRKKGDKRITAMEKWLHAKGKISLTDIAAEIGVTLSTVSQWKKEDKWEETLKQRRSKRKKGGQPNNINAVGHGAPEGNTNAVTHGAYVSVDFDKLPETVKAEIAENMEERTIDKLLSELKSLYAQEAHLRELVEKYRTEAGNGFMNVERRVKYPPKNEGEDSPTMEIEESSFARQVKVTDILIKVHGRIAKVLDLIKSAEMEERKLALEEKRYELSRQKALGVFDVEPGIEDIDAEIIED